MKANVKRMGMAENMKTTPKKRGAIWEEDQHFWKYVIAWKQEDQTEDIYNLKTWRPMQNRGGVQLENKKTNVEQKTTIVENTTNAAKKKDDLHLENMKTSAKRRAIIAWKYEDQHKEENGCNLKIRRPTWKGRQLQLEIMKINMRRGMGI